MNLIARIFRRAPKEPMPAKDPMDWRLTPSSGEWRIERYCPHCKATVGHREIMADICNTCGGHGDMTHVRSFRKIWDGSKWRTQFKYGNKPEDQVIE